MTVIMFAGQGAQRVGMGADVFDAFPREMRIADDVLGYSLRELCLSGPIERLTQTEFTQPALYVVGALQYLRRRGEGANPAWLMGHSVSEFTALFAGGAFDFATGLKIVSTRGALMAKARGGGMAAVLGLDAGAIRKVIAENGLSQVYAANFNTPKQTVISGLRAEIERAEPLFLSAGATFYKVLQVSGAFHTPLMAEAREAFAAFLETVEVSPPSIPVISNVTARPHSAPGLRERLAEQMTSPVRWNESLRYLLASGVDPDSFEELGSSGNPILKPIVRRSLMEGGPAGPADAADSQAGSPPPSPPALSQPSRGGASASGTRLGSSSFKDRYGLRYAYAAGAMYQGIASAELVARLARAGMLGFFGTGGLPLEKVVAAIAAIRSKAPGLSNWGMNFIAHPNAPDAEERTTDCFLEHGVTLVEASAFMEVTPALVRYRAKGLSADGGRVVPRNRIFAKVSRPDLAEAFLSPAPERIVQRLLAAGAISGAEAGLLRRSPMADAIVVEADSGGHTDQGMPLTLTPSILRVRAAAEERFPDFGPLHVGAGGGIGTPEAAAALFVMGVDFILTGSINQCTPEAATSSLAKDMLAAMHVHDTDYAPSGEMLELGSKVQVLKKGVFFPARANKLAALYRQHDSLESLDPGFLAQLEERYFQRSLAQVFDDIRNGFRGGEFEGADPKRRMGMVFKRYFRDTMRWAIAGSQQHKVDFQIHCGPALGAFNQWVAGTPLRDWSQRHVEDIGDRLMGETESLLRGRIAGLQTVLGS